MPEHAERHADDQVDHEYRWIVEDLRTILGPGCEIGEQVEDDRRTQTLRLEHRARAQILRMPLRTDGRSCPLPQTLPELEDHVRKCIVGFP